MLRFHFDATDSTNTQARRLAAEHPGERLLVTAAEQTAGRGRQGRTWRSPRGGAWLSVAWPSRQPPAHFCGASLAAAVGVCRGLCRVAPEATSQLAIKWPNDLLVDGRKLAGILCESFPAAAGTGQAHVLIVGVGVNVDFDPAELGGDLRRPATSLRAALGRAADVEAVIAAVADELETSLVEFDWSGLDEALLAELQARLADVGVECAVTGPAGTVRGRVVGVDAAGRLLLDGREGLVACDTGELEA